MTTCTGEDVVTLRLNTEHQKLLDKVVAAAKSAQSNFEALLEAETELVMFECANDIPLTDWTKYTRKP